MSMRVRHVRLFAVSQALILAACATLARGGDAFQSDPRSAELQALARALKVDVSRYGAGPLLKPGKTYYVAIQGNDKADGLTPKTAWRTIRRGARDLKPGDTLLISEGEYAGRSAGIPTGKPGRPVRVFAAPRARVVITPSRKVGPFRKTPGYTRVYEIDMKKPRYIDQYKATWEADTRRILERAVSVEHVDRFAGTHYFDTKKNKLYVRFSDSRPGEGRYVYTLRDVRGMLVGGEYVHIKGLWFKHASFYGLGLSGSHVTVEDCVFLANWGCGLSMYDTRRMWKQNRRAEWNLIRNNYGFGNEDRGTIKMGGKLRDNLIIGNRADPSPPTGRSGRATQSWAINGYGTYPGKDDARRDHIISNVMNDGRSFRWKSATRETVFQGNVCTGVVDCYGTRILDGTIYEWKEPADRIILRNNTILNGVRWAGEALGPGGWSGAWLAVDKASVNNFVTNRADRQAEVAQARFADPAYVDYRLQSDSPLKGKALGGGDLGAFRYCKDRIYYVGPAGSDANAGTSERLAFQTLGKAASTLQPGDTLYVAAGEYGEPLRLSAGGTAEAPIRVRAYRKAPVRLPGVDVSGAHVTLEGFEVVKAPGDAVRVTGAGVTLKNCLVRDGAGAGVRVKAPECTLNHCTIVRNRSGLEIEAPGATVRNSIVALNRERQTRLAETARAGYRGYSSCYFGPGADAKRVAAEPDSIVADPGFADASKGDFRLTWTSPALYLGEFAAPPGSREEVLLRQIDIRDVTVVNALRDMAVISWRTPEDDTTGIVRYRVRGQKQWTDSSPTNRDTSHAVALLGLKPETDYEVQVVAENPRARKAESRIVTLHTKRVSRGPVKHYVSPQGSDKQDGRTAATAWRSLRRACMEAIPGDTVLIAPGVYEDPIRPLFSGLPGRRITFRRNGEGEVLVHGRSIRSTLVELRQRSHVTVDGLTFVCDMPYGHPSEIISLWHGKDIEILNCRTHKVGSVGSPKARKALGLRPSMGAVLAVDVHGLRLEGNVFSGQHYPIRTYDATNLTIKNNTFAHTLKMHICLNDPCDNVVIRNNIFYQEEGRNNPYIFLRLASMDAKIRIDHNIFTPAPKMKIGNIQLRIKEGPKFRKIMKVDAKTLDVWQKQSGYDRHSLFADPMLVDPAKGDFRLKPGSPAIGAGADGADIGACGVAK